MSVDQQRKALNFRNLHSPGGFLVLPNIWDPIGARVLRQCGYPAVATASAAISASLGYEDGERIRRDTLLEILRRVACSVDIPVTADIERGYGETVAELQETVEQVIETGVVGINIEDGIVEGSELRAVDGQCRRIAAIREVATGKGLRLFINARVDSFLADTARMTAAPLDDAAVRARAYAQAGADCIFPVGPGDGETVTALRDRIDGPLNILASAGSMSLQQMKTIGVNRVSFGPFIFRSCLGRFVEISRALYALEDHQDWLKNMLPGEAIHDFLRPGDE